MELEEICVFDLDELLTYPLSSDKRQEIEVQILANIAVFGREPSYAWKARKSEEFLRILVDPFVLELVFLERTIELYGTAPAWARLLFTKTRRAELADTAESVLKNSGFPISKNKPFKPEPRRWADRRSKKPG